MGSIARLELLQLLRTRGVPWSLALFLALGTLALLHGREQLVQQRALLAEREPFLREQATYLVSKHDKELGLLLYHFAMPTEQTPSEWAPLARGLSDVYPFSQHLRLLSLVPQLYAAELGSPLRQLSGSFDYAFVITFLLPLLMMTLGYDVASRDAALGTELLLRAQPIHRSRLITLRLSLIAGLALGAALLQVALALALLRLPADARLAWWCLELLAYVVFWAGLLGLIASLDRSSGWNALACVGSWIALCVLIPALANALSGTPSRGGITLTLTARELLNAGYDKPKSATMQPFLARRPEWRGVHVPEDAFSWTWYYANQELSDLAVEREVQAHTRELEQREAWTRTLATVLPPLALQRALSHLAATDLDAQLAYRADLTRHHERLKQFFYPLLFRERPVRELAFDAVPRHRFQRSPAAPRAQELIGLLALAVLVSLASLGLLRRLDGPG